MDDKDKLKTILVVVDEKMKNKNNTESQKQPPQH